MIMIAHRLSTISDANKIIVLKDGLAGGGRFTDESLARGGVYAELHRIEYEQSETKAVSSARLCL